MAIKRKNSENSRIIVDKLRQDVNNKLLYWLKKVPRYNELNNLIAEANKNGEDTTLLLDELTILKALFNINKSKVFLEKQKEINAEKMEKMHKSYEWKSLIKQKEILKGKISRNTAHWYSKQIESYRNSLITSNSVNKDVIHTLNNDSHNVVDIALEEYRDLCEKISTILKIPVGEIFSMKTTNIKNKLTEHFEKHSDVKEMKDKLILIETKITSYINNFIQKPDITNVIFSAFGDIHDPNTEKILKEIIFSINILNVYSISQFICLKNQNTHISNDAIGFGFEGLTKAVNKWYETQLIVNHPLSFDAFLVKYVKYDITNGLRDIRNSGMIKSSNWNSITHKNQEEINLFLEKNPQYSHLEYHELFELLMPHSKTLKRVDSVSNESTITEKIASNSGNESDNNTVEIFQDSGNIIDSLDLIESKHEYERMLHALDEIFDTGKFVIYDYNHFDEPLYEESKEKIFTVYDKELFLMDIGFKYKHTTNQPYTLKEMAEILIFMYKQNGVSTNRIGEEKTFGVSTISIRLKKIRENLKMVIKHKPSLLEGFKYFVSVIDDDRFKMKNTEKLVYMSNHREKMNTNLRS